MTIGADGSYTYVASSDISDCDGAQCLILLHTLYPMEQQQPRQIRTTVIGGTASNQSPVAVNDTDSVNENDLN